MLHCKCYTANVTGNFIEASEIKEAETKYNIKNQLQYGKLIII
jgi:hypothetical protein